MIRQLLSALALTASLSTCAFAQHAAAVVSYDSGTTPAIDFQSGMPFDLLGSPLGEPARQTGSGGFAGPVTVFNPPYLRDQLLSVGEGGQVTLRLSHYLLPTPGGPELGVFTNAGLIDIDFPNGQAGSPPGVFGADNAEVSVSEDGLVWIDLGDVLFDNPTAGYSDGLAAVESDFLQPFLGDPSSFDGLPLEDAMGPDILDTLAGSGGGEWLDLSGTGLAKVGYVRFSVPDDGDVLTSLNFELDAVSIAHGALGAAIVPEPLALALLLPTLAGLTTRRYA